MRLKYFSMLRSAGVRAGRAGAASGLRPELSEAEIFFNVEIGRSESGPELGAA